MADLKLKHVTLRHWMKFKAVDLTFPDSGVVMVTGINTASGGAMQSVGSGKTGFGEAISRALFGVQGRFAHVKQFSGDKKGDTYVKVESVFLDKPLIVEMGYQCNELNPKSEALRFTYDGKQIERGTIAQTREELTKLLNISPLLASWTVFVDGEKMKFNNLTQADSVDLVMSALRQPPWTQYFDRTKTAMNKFRQSMAADEARHAQAARQRDEAQTALDRAVERLAEAQQDYNDALAEHDREVEAQQTKHQTLTESLAKQRGQQKELVRQMEKIEQDKAAEHHRLEIRQHDIEERIRKSKQNNRTLMEARGTAQTALAEKKLTYLNYRDAKRVCPTCNRPMGEALHPGHLAKLNVDYETALGAFNEADEAFNTAETKTEGEQNNLAKVHAEIAKLGVRFGISSLSEQHEQLDESIDQAVEQLHQIEVRLAGLQKGPPDSALKVAQSAKADRQKTLAAAVASLKEAAESVVLAQATLKVMDYWNLAFSPYGIPNMVLREAIAPLNAEAQRISTTMTGGTIEVVYNTTRELASGMEKAQLNIEVNNRLGSKDLAGSSKGESGLTNFIISETLSNVGQVSRRVGYRWYDEVVPHQDPKICHSIYTYLKEIAHNLGILIFLVDHNPIAANYCDHFLVVEKKGTPGNVVGSVYWKR